MSDTMTPQEAGYVLAIATRAEALFKRPEVTQAIVYMAVRMVHQRRGLRLQELVEADDFNFAHDVGGILQHLDFPTGELQDCFVPRFAIS